MQLNHISFSEHDHCDALTAAILDLPATVRREKVINLHAGQFLWMPADPPRNVYFLQAGRVEITEIDRSGKAALIQIIEPGEIFGYLCFCDGRAVPTGTEARAVNTSTVSRTSYEDFKSAVARSAPIAARLTEALCSRLSRAERRGRLLSIHDATKRLATLLHQLALIKSPHGETLAHAVSLHTSHAELAAQASLTRPHTTVLMTRFRTLGYVSYSRGSAVHVYLNQISKLL